MNGYACWRLDCPICHPRPVPKPPRDTFAELLLGGAALVALFVFFFVLLPVMA